MFVCPVLFATQAHFVIPESVFHTIVFHDFFAITSSYSAIADLLLYMVNPFYSIIIVISGLVNIRFFQNSI